MSIVVFQHEDDGGPGRLGDTLVDYGHRLAVRHLWRGDSVPPDLDGVTGVVSLGGPMNVEDAPKHPWMRQEMAFLKAAHDRELPVVGACLGSQLLASALGGEVGPLADGAAEVGFHEIRLTFPGTTDTILSGQPWRMFQFHWHAQQVTKLPAGAASLAGSKACKVQAWRAGVRTYAFQYHFEVDRATIENWSRSDVELRTKAGGLTHEQVMQQAARHYDDFARLSGRLCRCIADYLAPSPLRLRA